MATNAQKTHLAQQLERWGHQVVNREIQLQGKALPCSVVALVGNTGTIVTVKFEVNSAATTTPANGGPGFKGFTLPQVTVPVFGPEYIRYPLQVASGNTPGTRGVCFPADAYLGGVSGLGGGTASLAQPANLSALVFFPLGNTGFSATDDPMALLLYGLNGAILRSKDKTAALTVKQGDASTFHGKIAFDALVTMLADAVINSIVFSTHVHPVSADPGLTGPPQNP